MDLAIDVPWIIVYIYVYIYDAPIQLYNGAGN